MDGTARQPGGKPLSLLIFAMGGEGGGVLTGWIVAAARAEGLAVQATSVPGVAQRTGGTTYYVEVAARDRAGRTPVFALTPVAGQIDVVVASELAEAARAARLGFVTPDRTALIGSSHRVFLLPEKMAMGDGRLDPAELEASARSRSRQAALFDMARLARDAGVPISPVMLGALAGANVLPIGRAAFEKVIRDGGVAVERNLSAFAMAYARVAEDAGPAPASASRTAADFIAPDPIADDKRVAHYPAIAREVIARGLERLTDYQDEAYAAVYLQRIEPFRAGDPILLREVARQLALRMSYEDVIRVAQHKARSERFERIRGELGVTSDEPFQVQDYFKPGVRELADVMPPRIARLLLARAARGGWLAKAHVGMKLETTRVTGYLRVWLLAKLRSVRRGTHRYQGEQAAILDWLTNVRALAAREETALAREVVELARLIKGYGDTHARGSANYAAIMEALVVPALHAREVPAGLVERVRKAREAALADPDGKALGGFLRADAAPGPAATAPAGTRP